MNDDFMADITGAMWADWGRGDLQLIKDMGGNTIRMYGNLATDPGGMFGNLFWGHGESHQFWVWLWLLWFLWLGKWM